jgi:hypothetical protein
VSGDGGKLLTAARGGAPARPLLGPANDVATAAGLDADLVVPLMRPTAEVMQGAVLGAMPACAVSFSRSLMRRMIAERWRISRPHWDLSPSGDGGVIYRVEGPAYVMTWAVLVNSFDAYSFDGERAIERNWDIVGLLIDGDRDASVLDELRTELGIGKRRYRQLAPDGTIIWAQANRSQRVFEYVVDCLAGGDQPDADRVAEAGYLVRNVGLEGNGMYRSRAFLSLPVDHPMRLPYHGEMLSAYLLREFSVDLAEHMAAARSSAAVRVRPALRRYLGMGNSSGLGLVFFALQHPRLLSRWVEVREVALAAAKCAQPRPDSPEVRALAESMKVRARYARDELEAGGGQDGDRELADALAIAGGLVGEFATAGTLGGERPDYPWRSLCDRLPELISARTLEVVHGLLIDLDTALADRLVRLTVVPEVEDVDSAMTCGRLGELVRAEYGWALSIDMRDPSARRYWWYRSIESEEPRRGLRSAKPPDAVELALDLPTEVQALAAALRGRPADECVADFLVADPEHRGIVARVQSLADWRYHTPIGNIHGPEFRPANVIHAVKGAFYGADRCHVVERSLGRWVRGVFFSGAPTPAEIAAGSGQDWTYPCRP